MIFIVENFKIIVIFCSVISFINFNIILIFIFRGKRREFSVEKGGKEEIICKKP